MKKIGLTLGKYVPLHKGHQLVFDTMVREMDMSAVIIYDDPDTGIPLSVRSKWIRELYPQMHIIEIWESEFSCYDGCEHLLLEVEEVQEFLDENIVTAFYSSHSYGEKISRLLRCEDKRVNHLRKQYPAATADIRKDPYLYRYYIDDIVYRDLIIKVVFMGAMCTGKSTITQALAERYNTVYASEYGREYWSGYQVDRKISIRDYNLIAQTHLKREEESILKANKYIFVDTNAISTYMFSIDHHGKAPKLLTRLAMENSSRYDLFFLCSDDIPYEHTWDRSGSGKRNVFQKQIIADLNQRRIPFIPIYGDLKQRIEFVGKILDDFTPFNNYFGNKV